MSTRSRIALIFGLAVSLAGLGGASASAKDGTAIVTIKIVTIPGSIVQRACMTGQVSTPELPCGTPGVLIPQGTTTTQTFNFTCNPAGGDLPLLDSICRDIQLYPDAMLRPEAPAAYPYRSVCSGMIGYSPGSRTMTVETAVNGATFIFSDRFGNCGATHPPYAALLLYDTAITGDKATLVAIEPGLQCIADPSFLCVDEIRDSLGGLITAAERAPQLARLDPNHLFQTNIASSFGTPGTRRCTITVPGPNPGTVASFLAGRCTVTIQGLTKKTSRPTVVFTEAWPIAGRKTAIHTWSVVLSSTSYKARVVSLTESGPSPPQFSQ